MMPTGDYANHRYSHLDQINTGNVSRLTLAWSFSTGLPNSHEGNPLVIGNTMYVHTPFPNIVYALDLDRKGAIKWRYEPDIDNSVIKVLCCSLTNRGLAYADNTLFLYQADTTLVALDSESGREKWKVINGNVSNGESATNAPIVIKDKIIVGISRGHTSGDHYWVRGHVTAYATQNGRQLWRAYSMGPDQDILFDPKTTMSLGASVGKNSSTSTWERELWKNGGGRPWGWFAYDPNVNLLYYGTGNPHQEEGSSGTRPDQKWASSIIARNPDTGIAKWAYQMTPFDEWGYDGINEMILADIEVSGRARQVLVHFDKNGFGYTLDRLTGELLVAEKFLSATNWANGVNLDKNSDDYGKPDVALTKAMFSTGGGKISNTVCPSIVGAKNKNPASYSELTQLFYLPVTNLCMKYLPKKVNQGATSGLPPYLLMYPIKTVSDSRDFKGALQAWDAAAGKSVWTKPESSPVWSGVLTTAGGIVCYGTMEGYLKCLDQKNGEELFRYLAPSGITSNVMTYMHRGKQYIAVMSGVSKWPQLIANHDKSEAKDKQSKTTGAVIVLTLPDSNTDTSH